MPEPLFNTDPTVQEVAQAHINSLLKLEESEAKKILRKYAEIRQELRDRLDLLPQDTFTAQRLRSVIIQVEAAINTMGENILKEMSDSSTGFAEKGINDFIVEAQKFHSRFTGGNLPIDLNTSLIALNTKNFLFNRYEASLKSYGMDLRQNMAIGLTNAVIEKVSVNEVISRLSKAFLGEEWKLRRIVRTETHNIYNLGKLRGMEEAKKTSLEGLKKTLIHPQDNRTAEDSKYAAILKIVVPLDIPFEYTWNGKKREFMAPPDRPNDRSILVPYLHEWRK